MVNHPQREIRYLPFCCAGRSGLFFWGGGGVVVGLVLILTELDVLPGVVHDLIGPGILLALGIWVLTEAGGQRPPFSR